MGRQGYLFLILLMCISFSVMAQDSIQEPSFKGGEEARFKFIQENINYPKMARETGMEGTVYIAFIVMEDGTLDSLEIVRSAGELLDQEVIRLYKTMPAWQPALKNNQPIACRDTMPVRFRLAGTETTISDIKEWLEKERYKKVCKKLKWVENSQTQSTGHIYYYGLACYKRGQEEKGLKYIRKAAKMNDFEAKIFLKQHQLNQNQ